MEAIEHSIKILHTPRELTSINPNINILDEYVTLIVWPKGNTISGLISTDAWCTYIVQKSQAPILFDWLKNNTNNWSNLKEGLTIYGKIFLINKPHLPKVLNPTTGKLDNIEISYFDIFD